MYRALTAVFVAAFLTLVGAQASFAQTQDLAAIPPNKDHDLKLYLADGSIVMGTEAIGRMQKEADCILWLAGNQFFAMDEVIAAFRKTRPAMRVGLITLPPGLIVEAIIKGGWTYGGTPFPGLPDVYASVNIGHLKRLKAQGLMQDYMVYMHNELQLLVAKGNPKNIRGIADLGRGDVRTSMPNPVNEGIMQFYGRKVLERHNLWEKISGGKECVSCQTTPNNWFAAVHHRETPARIKDGLSDTGLVWRTEVLEAVREGGQVEGVELPPADSLRDEVSYVIGALAQTRHPEAAGAYLDFLATDAAQQAYAKFGFVKASADDVKRKPIP